MKLQKNDGVTIRVKTFHIKPDLSHRKRSERPVLGFGALGLLSYRRILVALTGTEGDTSVLRYLSMLDGIGSVAPNPNVDGVSDLEEDKPSIFFHHLQKGRKSLMNLVAQEGIDLILVGRATHQTRSVSDLRYLVLQAPCPVWVIPDSGNAPKLQSIVIPMDLRTPLSQAVQAASAIAEARHIPECLALNVYFLETRFPSRKYAQIENKRKWHAFAECISCIRPNGTWFTLHFEEGAQVSKVIGRFVEELDVDLVVMGTKRRSPFAGTVFGSTILETVESGGTPVLVVKTGESRFFRELLAAMFRPKDVLQTS
jgi:nucleotide-binding universal stress UspA family protein